MNDGGAGGQEQVEKQGSGQGERKIVKAKRKNRDKGEEKLVDEEGNEISFEDDSDDGDEVYIDDDVV